MQIACMHQHCLRTNYLAYLVRHPSLKSHPSPLGHGWEMVGGCCRPVRHTRAALPMHLPAPGSGEESEEDDEEEGDHDVERRCDLSESDDSEAEFCDDIIILITTLYVSLTFLFKIVSLLDGGHLGFPGRNDIMSN